MKADMLKNFLQHVCLPFYATFRYEWSQNNDNSIIYKIPPNLPLPKGGFIPLFGTMGQGEIF
jgi:hypothetical protein